MTVSTRGAPRRSFEILIVEDSPTEREQLRATLEGHDFRVRTATHGKEALEEVRKARPDLVISDIVMPELDGYGLCRAIKTDDRLAAIPVILVTGLSGARDVLEGLEAGADNFVTKPYDEAQLVARVTITAERQQVLDLLIASYEEAVNLSEKLSARQRELEDAQREAVLLHALTVGLNECRSEKDVVHCLLRHATEVAGVTAGWCFLVDGEGRITAFGQGPVGGATAPAVAGPGDCACLRRLGTGEIVGAFVVSECELMSSSGRTSVSDAGAHLAIPIVGDDGIVGVVNLAGKPWSGTNGHRSQLFESMVRQAGIALERAHLHDRLERRVAERTRELEEAQRRLRDFAESASDWYWELDEDLRYRDFNDRGVQTLGLAKDALIGRHRLSFIPRDLQREVYDRHAEDLAKKREFRSVPLKWCTSTGRIVHIRSSGKPVFDVDGRFLGYRGIGRDVTAEVEAEAARRENEAKLEALNANVPGCLFTCRRTRDGRYSLEYVSARSRDLFGIGSERIAADPGVLRNSVDSAFFERIRDGFARSAETLEGGALDGVFTSESGTRGWLRVLYRPRRDGDDVVFDGLVLDVTEQIEAEIAAAQMASARQEALERYSSVLNSIPAHIAVLDEHGVIRDVNERWRRFALASGFSGAAFGVGASYVDLCRRARGEGAEDAATVASGILDILEGRTDSWTYRYACHSPEEKRWFRLVAGPVTIAGKRGAVVMHVDVSEQVRLWERQAQLEQQLHQVQKMEAIGNLTGGMAHDFNNVLTIVMGNLEGLVELVDDRPAVRGLAETAIDACMRGAELTSQLLALARRQPLEPKPTDVNRLLISVCKMLARTLGEDIEIVVRTSPDACRVTIDPAQFEASITNLALNARDAMPKGGHLVVETARTRIEGSEVGVKQALLPGEYVRIDVTDTGVGIPENVINRIFEPFFTTKEAGKGTGLGLAMIFGFIKQSGGHINVYSEVGKGTTFRIYLPCGGAEDVDGVVERAAAVPARADPGERILVVEDNAGIRRTVVAQLEAAGFAVEAAKDGASALRMIEGGGRFDLVFSDVVMSGGISGVDLADRVEALRPGLPVLLTSGFAAPGVVSTGALTSGRRVLTKPYRRRDLLSTIRDVIDAGKKR